MKSVMDIDKNMFYQETNSQNLKWFKVDKNAPVSIYGTTAGLDGKMYRFSDEEIHFINPINEGVAYLSQNSAGICLKFKTTSKKIVVKAKLNGQHDMNHMPATGQCGFDLYVFDPKKSKYLYHATSLFNRELIEYECDLAHFSSNMERDFILNLPLYRGVLEMEIGIEENEKIEKSFYSNKGRIVVYGTSICQGGCVSRPGMLYTNLLMRELDIEILNYGFSGVAFGEKEVATLIGQRENQKLFIIDIEPNAGIDERLELNLESFIDEYQKYQPNVPIILVSRIKFAFDEYDEYRIKLRRFYQKFMKKIVKERTMKGQKIYFLDGAKFFKGNYTEYTVDGIHPTDLGSYEIYKNYYKTIKKVLSK